MDSAQAQKLLTTFITPGFSLLGVYIGARFQAHKDDARWAREQAREEVRWNREDKQRWLEDKNRLYSELMEAASAALASSFAAYDPHPRYSARRVRQDHLSHLIGTAQQDCRALKQRIEALALLGNPNVESTALDLLRNLAVLEIYTEQEDMSTLIRSLNDARDHFRKLRRLVREDLGVPDSEQPSED